MASRIIPAGVEVETLEMSWHVLGTQAAGKTMCQDTPAGGVTRMVAPQVREPAASAEEIEAEFQARLNSACDEAHKRGEAEGRSKMRAELENQYRALARAIEELAGHKPRLRHQAERDVVELAVAIARRILRRQITVDPEALLGLVKAALESVSAREVTEVRIHPASESLVRRHLADMGTPEAIRVVGDPGLEPGGVIVETLRGNVDSSIETQLEEVARGLADALAISRRRG